MEMLPQNVVHSLTRFGRFLSISLFDYKFVGRILKQFGDILETILMLYIHSV